MAIAKHSVPNYLWNRLVSVYTIQYTIYSLRLFEKEKITCSRPNSNFMTKKK